MTKQANNDLFPPFSGTIVLLMSLLLMSCAQAIAPPSPPITPEHSSNTYKLQAYAFIVKNITVSTAVISWLTNQPTKCTLICEAPIYGDKNTIEETDFQTNHDIEISSLFAEAEYKVHVVCLDRKGNAVTIDESFITTSPSRTGKMIGDYIPVFTLPTLDHKTINIKELRGKNVFLNFWNLPCPPCDKEMPYLQAFYDKYKSDNVIVFYTVACVGYSSAQDYIASKKLTIPVMLDSNLDVRQLLITGVPTSLIIDKYGRMAKIHVGSFNNLKEVEDFANLYTK